MLNRSKYRKFRSEEEAESWAWEHYEEIMALSPESKLYKDIFAYTGNLFVPVNRVLRALPPYKTSKFTSYDLGAYHEYHDIIPEIIDTLNQYKTPENIVVFRFTHLRVIKNLCGTRWLRSGLEFSDKAFLSTTLLRNHLVAFGKQHHCNCVLELCLPQGTHGAYVSLPNPWDLKEYEFLLPPNIKLKIINIYAFTYPVIIKCIAQVD